MTGEAPVAAAAVEKKVEPEVTAKSEEEDNELVPNEDKQERTAKAMEAEAEKAEPIHPVAAVAEPKEEAVKEAAEEKEVEDTTTTAPCTSEEHEARTEAATEAEAKQGPMKTNFFAMTNGTINYGEEFAHNFRH